MYLDTPALKQWYVQERKKLESLPAFEREASLAFLNYQKRITTEIKWDLTAPETLASRPFVVQHIKQLLFKNNENKHAVSKLIDEMNDKEKKHIDENWDKTLAVDSHKIHDLNQAYAEYFYQLEKVNRIEAELKTRGLTPELVYEEASHHKK